MVALDQTGAILPMPLDSLDPKRSFPFRAVIVFALGVASILGFAAVVALALLVRNTWTEAARDGIAGEAFFKADGHSPEELAGLLIEVYPMAEYGPWLAEEKRRIEKLKMAQADESRLRKMSDTAGAKLRSAESAHAKASTKVSDLRRAEEKNRTELQNWEKALATLHGHQAHIERLKNDRYPFTDPVTGKQVALSWHKREEMEAHFHDSKGIAERSIAERKKRATELARQVSAARRSADTAKGAEQRAALDDSTLRTELAEKRRIVAYDSTRGPVLPPTTAQLGHCRVALNGSFKVDLKPGNYWLFAKHSTNFGIDFYWSETVKVVKGSVASVQLNGDNAYVYASGIGNL